MWDEIRNIKSDRESLFKFGLTIGAILAILGVIFLWRSRGIFAHFIVIGILFIISGLVSPIILKPIQKLWMAFSIIVGFFMSRLILTLLFYGVVTPIGLVMRIFGKDILDERIEKTRVSYWRERPKEARDRQAYERQF